MSLNQQTVGNVGLYYTCYQLSLRGWNVMPTARNARGVDIVAYSADATRTFTVQVKSLSKRSPVPLGKNLDHLFADFVVVCRYVTRDRPECFVLTPAEIRQMVHRGVKDERVSYWLHPKRYEAEEFRERWERVGTGEELVPGTPSGASQPTAPAPALTPVPTLTPAAAATAEDFRAALSATFADAEGRGFTHVDVDAGSLHRRVGGYPGPSHRMPSCCDVMRSLMRTGDVVTTEPPKGRGASLTVRYLLPRPSQLG